MRNKASQLENYPVIGICGSSGAGKTTLVEALIPRLSSLGLRLAVVKDGAHNVVIDKPGKDSDRFFQAGADVALFGDTHFIRCHQQPDFHSFLIRLCADYDMVLVEGHASTAMPKIWLLGQGYEIPPTNQGTILEVLTREEATVERIFIWLQQWLKIKWLQTPVWGCVLIGGKSKRMGRPKHLIERDSSTWLEQTVRKLAPLVEQVVISGQGQLPDSMIHLPRIPDAPGLAGPLSGILAIMRFQPAVSWLVMACDLPAVEVDSLHWLLEQRRPGIRAVLPDLEGDGRIEPLLAWYDYRCRMLLEEIAASGSLRISQLAGQQGVFHFQPPREMHGSWRNVNTPEELNKE